MTLYNQQEHQRQGNQTAQRCQKHRIGAQFLLAAVQFRKGENDRSRGGGAENIETDFEGLVKEREKVNAKVGKQGVDDQLQRADTVSKRLRENGFELHRGKPLAEDEHAQRRGHLSEQGYRVRYRGRETDLQQVERNRNRNRQRGGVQNCRFEGNILFLLRDEENPERKDQKIHARDVHRGVAGNNGLVGEESRYQRKPEEADIPEHRADREDAVFRHPVFAVENQIEKPEKEQLRCKADPEELRRLGEVGERILHRLICRENQTGGADIEQKPRKRARVVGAGFFGLDQHEPARHVEQHNQNIDKNGLNTHGSLTPIFQKLPNSISQKGENVNPFSVFRTPFRSRCGFPCGRRGGRRD